jgi:hypothetical protein
MSKKRKVDNSLFEQMTADAKAQRKHQVYVPRPLFGDRRKGSELDKAMKQYELFSQIEKGTNGKERQAEKQNMDRLDKQV